jgi:hypothetical protein
MLGITLRQRVIDEPDREEPVHEYGHDLREPGVYL